MSAKVGFYKVRHRHKEIFGTDAPCSFFDLMLAVEAPEEFSGINIFEHVEQLPLGCVIGSDHARQISEEERRYYPFYDLFRMVYEKEPMPPFILENTGAGLECIEGRHRMRVLRLFKHYAHDEFIERLGDKIPCIVVNKVAEQECERTPIEYQQFMEWLSTHSWKKDAQKRLGIYAKFLSAA